MGRGQRTEAVAGVGSVGGAVEAGSAPGGGRTTADAVRRLRAATGGRVAECRRALEESAGDAAAAAALVGAWGVARGERLGGRDAATAEGRVAARTSADGTAAALVHLACQTAGAAASAPLVALAEALAARLAEDRGWAVGPDGAVPLEALLDAAGDGETSGRVQLAAAAGALGEAVVLRRAARVAGAAAAGYTHLGRIAAVVALAEGAGTREAAAAAVAALAREAAAGAPADVAALLAAASIYAPESVGVRLAAAVPGAVVGRVVRYATGG